MSLVKYRAAIDKIDRQVIELLAERFKVAEKVAAHKIQHRLKARILPRIRRVIREREKWGRAKGLPQTSTARIWEAIVEETCRFEEMIMKPTASATKPDPAKE